MTNCILRTALASCALLGSIGGSSLDAAESRPTSTLHYAGTLTPTGRNSDGEAVKQFQVTYVVLDKDAGEKELAYIVSEPVTGHAWPERFGLIELDAAANPGGKSRAAVLYTHEETPYSLAVRVPFLGLPEAVAEKSEWELGEERYTVSGSKRIGEQDCWRVDVTGRPGRPETLWVAKSNGRIIAAEQTIVMGRGDQFILATKMEKDEPVAAESAEKVKKPITALLRLRGELGRREDETSADLSDEQLKRAAAVTKELVALAEATPFQQLSIDISRDVESQQNRTDKVAALASRFLGQAAPAFELMGLDRHVLAAEDRADKIVLLHFWSYRDNPLVEPYGQVGYLDFLHNRRGKLGVKVYGVAVDQRLGEQATSGPALRQIRNLKEFMNLGYPVTIDDGSLLAKFGDPRQVGSKLPLWVLIGPDGKIAHYSVGFYPIKPDEGLRTLDEEIVKLIRKSKEKKAE